jgi:hypothetical protein
LLEKGYHQLTFSIKIHTLKGALDVLNFILDEALVAVGSDQPPIIIEGDKEIMVQKPMDNQFWMPTI